MTDTDIPDFLRRAPERMVTATHRRRHGPKIVMPKTRKRSRRWLPKTMTPEAWEILRHVEAEQKRKADARYAKLREAKR